MTYRVPASDIKIESRTGGDGILYFVRVSTGLGKYEGELILCESFDINSDYADMSVSDGENGFTFADFFRYPFNLDTLDNGPALTESEIAYANSFMGAKIYRESAGPTYLRFFKTDDELDLNWQDTLESSLS